MSIINTLENTPLLKPIVSPDELKLLSLRKASNILGIRYDHLLQLLNQGRIRAIRIGKRQKIPYMSLVDFIKSETAKPLQDNGIISPEETQSKIDALIKEYSKHGNNF